MNRGILIIGIASVFVALGNVYASGIFFVLICIDSCPPALQLIGASPQTVLLPFVALWPALALILVAWVWEIIELRRLRARGTLLFVALAPLIALAAIAGATALTAATQNTAPLNFKPLQLWAGEFAIVIWPLLVSIIAFIQRRRAVGAGAGSPIPPPSPASPVA